MPRTERSATSFQGVMCKTEQSKKKVAALIKVDLSFSLFRRGLFLKRKGRAMQVSLPEFKRSKRMKFYYFHTIVMSRCQTLDMLCTQDQVNSVKHKRKVYNGSGPYARRMDLFSNE